MFTRLGRFAVLSLAAWVVTAAPVAHAAQQAVVVTPTRMQVVEGAEGTYTLTLTKAPTGDVLVFLTPSSGNVQVSPNPVRLSATALTATVAVTTMDDALATGDRSDSISHRAVSVDRGYAGIGIDNVVVEILDNDAVRSDFVVDESALEVAEGTGGEATYTLSLTRRPLGAVMVSIATGDEVSVSPSSVQFDDSNWQDGVTVTVNRANDDLFVGTVTDTITHSATSTDLEYDGLSGGDIEVSITDNDVLEVRMAAAGGTFVTEGGATDTYTLMLTGQPEQDVVITTAPEAGHVSASPATLTFTAANFNTPQAVTVSAVNDARADGPNADTVVNTAASADSRYAGIAIPSVPVLVTDNDTAAVSINELGGVSVSEGGTADSYTVVLTSEPYAPVTVTATAGAQIGVAGSATGPFGSSVQLTFTAANWNAAQPVFIQASDDAIAEGGHSSSTTHVVSSGDGAYNNFDLRAVAAAITDNDVASLVVRETDSSTRVTEDGKEDSIFVKLTSEPSSPVTITVDPGSQLFVVEPASGTLTFNAGNYGTEQEVILTAVDDAAEEPTFHGALLQVAVTAGGSDYAGQSQELVATITDNDVLAATVVVSKSQVTVSEAGDAQPVTYNLRLNKAPTESVVIRLQSDNGQVLVNGTPATALTFDDKNYATPQTVTVKAVDDRLQEGTESSLIEHSVLTQDAEFDEVEIPDVRVTILDNDANPTVPSVPSGN
jgi:large repetitive protein